MYPGFVVAFQNNGHSCNPGLHPGSGVENRWPFLMIRLLKPGYFKMPFNSLNPSKAGLQSLLFVTTEEQPGPANWLASFVYGA
jgi:hypothetical protein